MPSLCNTLPGLSVPCRSQSTQCFAFQSVSTPLAASPLRFYACLCHCAADLDGSVYCYAFALQFRALHIFATALHIDAVRCHCFACPRRTSPLLRHTLQGKSWPRPCYQLLRFSSAMLCVSSPCLCSSERSTALPLQVYSLQCSAVAFLCSTKHCAAMAFLCSANPCVAIAMQR